MAINGTTQYNGMCTTVDTAVSLTSGNQGQLECHAIAFDLVSNTSRRNKNTTNVMIPTHTDPIWQGNRMNII
jgi:hypothetical protein